MHFKFRNLNKIIGAFFILTCLLILGLLVIVARGERWFQEYVPYHSYFDNGGGLDIGSPVYIRRLEAGKVSGLSLNQDNRVRVDLDIFKQYANRIREGSLVKMVTPLVGSSRLDIVPGKADTPLSHIHI
jgi:ABC-type transporter Mla subunit MlaD